MLDGRSAPVSTRAPRDELSILSGAPHRVAAPYVIVPATDQDLLDGYRALRLREFVERQGLFDGTDRDDVDDDPRLVTLVARAADGTVLGGVRLAPCLAEDLGWWAGSRLVVDSGPHTPRGVGAALVRAACAYAETAGVLRFEAVVQDRHCGFFTALGWNDVGSAPRIGDRAHRRMRWQLDRIQRAADASKAMLAGVLAPFVGQHNGLGGDEFRGDDGVPLPGSEIVAACDSILPAMVERDPEWAGWCSVLVNLNDLAAMGATPVGLLDALGAPSRSHLERIIRGIAAAAAAWQVPVLGGHTQLGVHSSLSVTALGSTRNPIPAGGGESGDIVSVVTDLGGRWRPGYHGQQWDSTSTRSGAQLQQMNSLPAQLSPKAAKDVSMAGLVGTLGMLAEASGTGAELDVAAIPRPRGIDVGSWVTCFPGYAMLIADREGVDMVSGPVTAAACGRLDATAGIRLRWPDGETTVAISSTVTGLGQASSPAAG